jgi:hypothetical protein
MPTAIRPATDADKDWVKPLMDEVHLLGDDQLEAVLKDPRSVSYGDPTIPTFCRCVYIEVLRGHSMPAGMSTQVAYLLPLKVDEAYLRATIMPLLAKTWYEVGVKFPRALSDPLWAQLDVPLAALFEKIIGTERAGRVVSLPTLQEGIDKVAAWL